MASSAAAAAVVNPTPDDEKGYARRAALRTVAKQVQKPPSQSNRRPEAASRSPAHHNMGEREEEIQSDDDCKITKVPVSNTSALQLAAARLGQQENGIQDGGPISDPSILLLAPARLGQQGDGIEMGEPHLDPCVEEELCDDNDTFNNILISTSCKTLCLQVALRTHELHGESDSPSQEALQPPQDFHDVQQNVLEDNRT